ncbi:MAG TPA: CBS domain-containing protein [Patescibacteria group bacterium]|nr:CBS domain-containing protein [Patescibacteria group bacterium]
MNSFQQKFIYLSQLIHIPVLDFNTNKKIGYAVDFVAALREMYPRFSALLMRDRKSGKNVYIPWKNIRQVIPERAISIEVTPDIQQQEVKLSEAEILLKDVFWDKQIVDIAGSKVVRVNDLHILKEGLNLWVVHMDIGLTGIIRRLGWIRFVQYFVKLVTSCELEERLISWKFVQPVTPAIGTEALALKVPHSKLAELHPAELADVLADLGSDERITIIKSLDTATAAGTFQVLPLKIRIQIAESLDQKQLVTILNEMAMDELVDLLSELPKKKRTSLLARLPQEKVTLISSLLGHADDIAGSIMNTQYTATKYGATAGAVLDKIKTETHKTESVYYIYVLDDNDLLVGVVTLHQLLTAPAEKPIFEFMRKRVAKVRVHSKIRDVAEVFYKYGFGVVPVVDKQNKLQGIITMKDAFEAVFPQIKTKTEEAG